MDIIDDQAQDTLTRLCEGPIPESVRNLYTRARKRADRLDPRPFTVQEMAIVVEMAMILEVQPGRPQSSDVIDELVDQGRNPLATWRALGRCPVQVVTDNGQRRDGEFVSIDERLEKLRVNVKGDTANFRLFEPKQVYVREEQREEQPA